MMKHIELDNQKGKTLRGYLHWPSNFNGKIVLMYHGFTGNKTEHGGIFRDISRSIEKEGLASLRMDFSGNGESDGSFRDFTFTSLVDEANLLVDYVKSLEGVKEVYLLGFSMGGALAAMIAGKRKDDFSKLVLISPAALIIETIKSRYEITSKLANGDADLGNYPLSLAMYESLAKYDILEGIENFDKPVLLIHGMKDLAVSYERSLEYEKKYANATLHLIEKAGHGYDRSEQKNELINETVAFLKG